MRPIPQEAKTAVAEATRRHRGEMSMAEFAEMLGANSRQAVDNWEKGKNAPTPGFLLQSMANQESETARQWAADCLQALGLPVPTPAPLPEPSQTSPIP